MVVPLLFLLFLFLANKTSVQEADKHTTKIKKHYSWINNCCMLVKCYYECACLVYFTQKHAQHFCLITFLCRHNIHFFFLDLWRKQVSVWLLSSRSVSQLQKRMDKSHFFFDFFFRHKTIYKLLSKQMSRATQKANVKYETDKTFSCLS